MSRFPVPIETEAWLSRLALRERELGQKLAELEGRSRRFEDEERPAYERWLRLELGPTYAALGEVIERIRVSQAIALRVRDLVEEQGLHPREALYLARAYRDGGDRDSKDRGEPQARTEHFNEEEVAARRQAKRQAKREARREAKREKRRDSSRSSDGSAGRPERSNRSALVRLYRALARKLHPDSADSLPADRARGLWLEVQEAYVSGRLDRLVAVAAWIGLPRDAEGLKAEARGGRSPVALSIERVRFLERSCSKLEMQLTTLRDHPGWMFLERTGSDRKKLRKKAARDLEDELQRAQEALESLEDFIDSIGPPRPPRR